jgi:hypothetical protein
MNAKSADEVGNIMNKLVGDGVSHATAVDVRHRPSNLRLVLIYLKFAVIEFHHIHSEMLGTQMCK